MHGANKHSACSCQQPALANALAPAWKTQLWDQRSNPFTPEPRPSWRHRYKGSRAVPAKLPPRGHSVLLRTSIRTSQPCRSPSFPVVLALGWGVAPCFGWLSHDHRGQSGALASIRQGPASKQGLGSTLLIYWDPESSSSRRELPPAFPFLEHGGVVLHVY